MDATLAARLLTVALALPGPYYPPGHAPETASERAARVELIVTAASRAADDGEWPGTPADLAASVLTVSWYESRRWALEVHDGRKRGDHGSSICLAQIWSKDRTLAATTPEATRRCFERAVEILELHAHRCGIRNIDEERIARLFGAYGTGRTCHAMDWSRNRARTWARFAKAVASEDPANVTAVTSTKGHGVH
jgi:hypothetical protein